MAGSCRWQSSLADNSGNISVGKLFVDSAENKPRKLSYEKKNMNMNTDMDTDTAIDKDVNMGMSVSVSLACSYPSPRQME